MNKFFIVCVMVMACPVINAQNVVKGRVTDQDSLPLDGASVFIPETNKSTITDADGNYEFRNLPNGNVKIQFSFISHASTSKQVVLAGAVVLVNVVLVATAIETEEIVVTAGYHATQRDNAVKIDVIKINPLSSKITPNFAEVLTKVPGVDMISKGNGVSKPVIRGLSMNDILILNNGVRFENYQYSSHHPMGIDEFGIDAIEIIKGPASLMYGSDAIGGVINFMKEKPATENSIAGDYNMQLFSNSLGATNNFGIKGASNRFFGGIRVGQKTNADYLQGGGAYVPNSRSNTYSIKTNAGYTGTLGSFKVFYDYNRQHLGLVEDEAIAQIVKRGRLCNIFYQQLGTHLLSSQNNIYIANARIEVNSAYQNTELIHFANRGVYEIQMRLATLTYEAKLYLPSDKKSEYILGFQGANQANTNLNNRATILLPDASMGNYSGFCMLQRTLSDKLKLQTGVRYDNKTISSEVIGSLQNMATYRAALDKNYGSFSGSFGATYAVSDKLLFRANIASAYRTPNLAELTSNGQHETRYEVGDQRLVPEKSYETDLSAHLITDNVTFDVAGFNNAVRHYIFIMPTGDTSATGIRIYRYTQNHAKLFGGEAGLHINPMYSKWLHFETLFSSVVGKQQNGNYLPFVPASKLNFELRLEKDMHSFVQNAFVSANANTAFAQNNAATDETVTAGYTLFDLSMGANITIGNQHVVIAVSVSNMFDKKYVDHLSTLKEVDLYNPGRNFTLSVKVPFEITKN